MDPIAAAKQAVTVGVVDAIFNDPERANATWPVPVLQCLQIKTLEAKPGGPGPATAERYRIVLSDTVHYVQCMLATQANHVVHDGLLQRGCFVRMKQFQANAVKGRNILIVLDLDVIQSLGTPEKIGEPTVVESRDSGAGQPMRNTTIGGAGFYGAPPAKKEEEAPPTHETKPLVSRAQQQQNYGRPRNHGNNVVYPIEALSLYAHKWTIKARVTSKSEIRTWHKASGEGKLFSVNLLDESGEIKATGFNDQVDQFYDLLHEGQVYYISNPCRVTPARKQFSTLANDYELIFERDTPIEKAEDQSSVPQVRFTFVTLQQLQEVDKDATVDVIAILRDAGDLSEITSKTTGKPYEKRELTVVDDSAYAVRLTIWGKSARAFDASPESVLAFKGVRVSDFNGRSLSLLSSGTMTLDPDIPEAHRLKGWYDAAGRHADFHTHNNNALLGPGGGGGDGLATGRSDQVKTVAQVLQEQLGMDKVDYFAVTATVVYIKQDTFCYPACATDACNKKVADMGDGTWHCERCSVAHPRPLYRYILSVNICDHTGQMWISCFDDIARVLMHNRSADDLMDLRDQQEDTRLAAEFDAANCRLMAFRCRAKMDTFGDTQRVRYQAMAVSPVDHRGRANQLLKLIESEQQGM